MRARLAVAAAVFILAATPTVSAQVLPPPPSLPPPPAELEPLLELLAGPGGTATEPVCAVLGTVLGLGSVVIPGVPGTVEQLTGLPLSGLPIALQPELLTLVDTILFVQGAGCGLLPLAAERTVCASDDEIAAALDQVRQQLNLIPDLPVQVGDFVPVPPPTAGSIVDTFRTLAALGAPGAAEVVAALNDVGDCGLRTRFTNVEPPGLPTDPKPPAPPPLSPQAPPPAIAASGAPARLPVLGPVVPSTPDASIAAPAPLTAPTSTSSLPVPNAVPGWLRWAAVAALVAFLYRAVAPASPP